MECPLCGNFTISLSKRGGVEKFLKYLIPAKPFRCKDCRIRFWKLYNPLTNMMDKVVGGMIIIGVFSSLMFIYFLFQSDKDYSYEARKRNIIKKTISIPYKIENPGASDRARDNHQQSENEPIPNPQRSSIIRKSISAQTLMTVFSKDLNGLSLQPNTNSEPDDDIQGEHIPEKAIPISKQSENAATKTIKTNRRPAKATVKTPGVAKPLQASLKSNVDGAKRSLIAIQTIKLKGSLKVLFLLDRPVDQFKSFFIQTPPKLVIDLKGKWTNPEKYIYWTNNAFVEKFRTGIHPGYLRIVVDLKGEKPLPTDIEKSEKGLTLIITENITKIPKT